MAKFLSQKVTTKLVFTHYFQNSANQRSDMATPFIVALLSQLLENDDLQAGTQLPKIIKGVVPLFDHFKTAAECPFHKLWPLVQLMFEAVPCEFTLVVDALDECNDSDHSQDLSEKLSKLSLLSHARIILLSRYHDTLSDSLAGCSRVAMDSVSVTPDISLLVKREIERTALLQPVRHQILEKATQSCRGIFMWAKIMLDHLRRARSQKIQLRSLQNFPAGLAEVYEQFLSEVAATLDQEEKSLRRSIFLVLVGACRPLSLDELSTLLALRPSGVLDEGDLRLDPKSEVLRLCWPLAMVDGDTVSLVHMSVKDFLIRTPEKGSSVKVLDLPSLSLQDANEFLAAKCLSKLGQDRYKLPNKIAPLLRRNVKVMEDGAQEEIDPAYEMVGYDYACQNWQVHLVAVTTPKPSLLQQAAGFLQGYGFVAWSEYLSHLGQNEDFCTAIKVRANLESWLSQLAPDLRKFLPLDGCFDLPYRLLTRFYERDGGDRLLPLFCKARLGEYWSLAEAGEQGFELMKSVAGGFQELLGERNPLTLRAECNVFVEYSWMNRWSEAFKGLSRIAQTQHDAVGDDRSDYYFTLEYAAWADYSMTNFHNAAQDQAKAAAGLFRTRGSTGKECLRSQMFQSWTLERQGLNEQALFNLEEVWNVWTTLTDTDNPMSQMLQKSLASVRWKRGELAKAEKLSLENFAARQRTFTMQAVITIDAGFQLAVLYRELGRPQEALALLDLMNEHNDLSQEFERHCQFEHLRALLAHDTDDSAAAIYRLQTLLHQATNKGRSANNRELLWVRLTLADMLRRENRSDEAAALFGDLVRPATGDSDSYGSLAEEPDTPQQLAIAEEALNHVRRMAFLEAERLLRENGLEWVRYQDFWILFGGPITDTAAMKGLRDTS